MNYIDDELSRNHSLREERNARDREWLAQAHEIAVICVDFSARFLARARSVDSSKPWTELWQRDGGCIFLDLPVTPLTKDELRARAGGLRSAQNRTRYHWWEKMGKAEALRDVTRRHQWEMESGAQAPTWVLAVGHSDGSPCNDCTVRFLPASTVSEVEQAVGAAMRHTIDQSHGPYMLSPETVGRDAARALMTAG